MSTRKRQIHHHLKLSRSHHMHVSHPGSPSALHSATLRIPPPHNLLTANTYRGYQDQESVNPTAQDANCPQFLFYLHDTSNPRIAPTTAKSTNCLTATSRQLLAKADHTKSIQISTAQQHVGLQTCGRRHRTGLRCAISSRPDDQHTAPVQRPNLRDPSYVATRHRSVRCM